jgi:two-component system sensor histidine kinase/response regulator
MKKFNILVIDSNEENRSSFEQMLLLNDYRVQTAQGGRDGMEILNVGIFDMIFIDSDLPGRESFQTCKTIKADARLHKIPVLFIIGNNSLNFLNEVYESGGDDYISKPLVWSELLMKSRVHLELRYSREMAKNMNHMLESKVAQRTIELEDSLQKLGKAKKDLELLTIAKSEFLNMISHEIRTPLNGILGSMALIGRYHFSDDVNRYYSLLDASVRRLEKFSNTILEAATLRLKGAKALVYFDIDLLKILYEAVDLCKIKYADKAIEIDIKSEGVDTKLRGDQRFLLKCFVAVLDNAFKFSPKMKCIKITVSNYGKGFLKIEISDDGKGFSNLALCNLFEPLSNQNGHFDQNTGMGLHLAKTIVDAHSGFMSVKNNVSGGATIEILLPVSHH